MAGISSLVPDMPGLFHGLSLLDWIGMGLFIVATVVYHGFYALWMRRHPLETVKGKVALYRRTWVKRVLDRDEQILAVQSIRNLLMASSFLASSAMVVIAVILNFMLGKSGAPEPTDPVLQLKLLLLVAMYGFAFFSFLLSTRYLNHFTILVGADRDLIGSVEPVDAVTFLTNLLNRASNAFTMGQRGFYFSLPLVAWIVDARAFIGLTAVTLLYLAVFLDFKKWRPPFPLRARGPEDVEAQPPAGPSTGSVGAAGTRRGSHP